MNLNKIKEVLEAGLDQKTTENIILNIIVTDKNSLPQLIRILHEERKENDRLIKDMNLELSRTLVTLDTMDKGEELPTKPSWVVEQAKDFYNKWKNKVRCCFKMEGIP